MAKSFTDTNTSVAGSSPEDFKDQNLKYSLSKFEHDLYHEEEDVALPVIRVRRFSMPNKGEKWKVMSDNKVTFVIESNKISKKEREFLQTVQGFNFMLSQAKTGIKSLNSFRVELKKILNDKNSEEEVVEAPIVEKVKTKKSSKKQK